MQVLVLLSDAILTITFGVALYGKAREYPTFRNSLSSFGLPSSTHGAVALSTLLAEAFAIIALLTFGLRWAGVTSLALLLAFSAVSAFALLAGRRPQCQCFGNLTEEHVGLSTLLRNLALAGFAVLLLTEPQSLTGVVQSADAQTLVMSALASAIAGLLAVIVVLLRRYGEALHTLEAIGVDTVTHLPKRGLEPGEPVPELMLRDWDSCQVALSEEIRNPSQSTILVLMSTTCRHCEELIPSLIGAAAQGILGVVIVQGRDSATTERLHELRDNQWPVLFAERADLTTHFRIVGFPGLVPVDEQGNIEGGTLLGRQSI